jgi:hypothetical protein
VKDTSMTVEADREKARREVVEAARRMLAGTLAYIEGARLIAHLFWDAEIDQFDPDILPFVGIDSETDALPLGKYRQGWAAEALAKLQPEIDRAEEWARGYAHVACEGLIRRFGFVAD